jgi:hypothetical protein
MKNRRLRPQPSKAAVDVGPNRDRRIVNLSDMCTDLLHVGDALHIDANQTIPSLMALTAACVLSFTANLFRMCLT